MKKALFLFAILLFWQGPPAFAQPSSPGESTGGSANFAKIVKATKGITLDGVLDEPDWYNGVAAKNFWQWFPTDSLQAEVQTEVYFTYDDENFYVAAKNYSIGDKYVIESLRRDFRAGGNDNITFVFDTFNDGANAFVFGTNPAGVLREALISNGGQRRGDFSESWDNTWDGKAAIGDGYWTVEFAIPFKTLRFKEGSTRWGFNCYRFDYQNNERTSWMKIPLNQSVTNLAYTGDLLWDTPLGKSGKSFSVIPYISGDMGRDFQEPGSEYSGGFNVGGDAKVAITSGLNLDLTVNPDFSQVEVDRQVTDLQRFELFFPERRQFFLENADLFGGFGTRRINPFFSRRIGIAQDTSTGDIIQNPIPFGARLSGKLSEDWRVGLLNMQTAKDTGNDLPGFNYTVAAVQRKLFSRSNVGLIFVNKQAFSGKESGTYNTYNRVVGLDYNLATPDNSWTGKAFYHRAITPEDTTGKFAHSLDIGYRVDAFELRWNHELVGEGYDAEVGFVPRKDFFRIRPSAQLFFYPQNPNIVQHGPELRTDVLYTPGYGRSDHTISLQWSFSFLDQSRLSAEVRNEYIYLFDDFDPTREYENYLPAETDYSFTNFSMQYSSDRSKPFSVQFEPLIGQFYNGFRTNIRGSVRYRFQPFGDISFDFNYNRIRLDAPFEPVNLYLTGPRIDLTFTKDIYLTTFIQYNSQIDNLNINARFQWRFAPVSDFFLVYTDNYLPNDWSVKNRSIVAKLTYWLNL
jgi:uncharacterized protein DUF5916